MGPTSRNDLHARAWQAYHAGDRPQAERLCWQLLREQPLQDQAVYLLGVLALEEGQTAQALLYFHHLTLLQPANAAYHNALGEAYRIGGRFAEAAACYHEAIRHDPTLAAAHHALGMVFMDQKEVEAAVGCFRQALALRPDFARAHLNLGRALQMQGDLEAAGTCYAEALRLQPDYAIAHNNLGAARQAQGRLGEATASFREAIRLLPNYPEAHFNLGTSLQAQGDPAAAGACFREALRLRPDYPRAHCQLGLILDYQRHDTEAVACFQAAVRLQPDDAEAYRSLGNVLMRERQWEAAQAAMEQAAALRPDDPDKFASLFYLRQMLCDWRSYAADLDRLWSDATRQLAAGQASAVIQFQALTLPWPAERLLAIARSHSQALSQQQVTARAELDLVHPRSRPGRLRIGYLSGDFYDHPIGHLLHGLFGRHDRQNFEVFAYSFGPDDGSVYRRRIAAECEHFADVANLSLPDLARRIHADGIHILIDLMGYTGVTRMAVLAVRPAPIQVSYLGMLGTMGAVFIDYLITDAVVTPPELAGSFSERFVTMPHSYLATEPPPAARRPSRRACGLPENGFVFCSFNSTYKIEPRGFNIWMKILAQVPDSVLWLYSVAPACANNLRRAAAALGVAAERLIFASFLPRAEHLARHALADLFLDTLTYNAAATATLALGAGLPVLTCPGATFAARVGASLLTAIGLPELIASDVEHYEHLAVHFARHPDELRRLREKLAAHRTGWPLFDVPRFVRNLERAYQAMWEVYAAGRPPQSIVVIEGGV